MIDFLKTTKNSVCWYITICVMLCTIGILIPIYSPLKLDLDPASFTLASHMAIFLAMFVSPTMGLIVSLCTTFGFYLAEFSTVDVFRSATHMAFAQFGALYLLGRPYTLNKRQTAFIFSFLLGCVHAFCEIIVVIPYYFGNGMHESYYSKGFFTSVILYVGVGSVIHSMVDFEISLALLKIYKMLLPSKLRR